MSQRCDQRTARIRPSHWFHMVVLLMLGLGLAWVSSAAAEQASSHARPFQAGYLDASGEHTCAVLLGGSLRCWGTNRGGRLGMAGSGAVVNPANVGAVPVSDGRTDALAAGLFHTCAIVGSGAVECWGYAANGRLGTGVDPGLPHDQIPTVASAADATPVDLGPGRTARAIAAGLSHTCAILDTGQVRCWGTGSLGRLGNGGMQDVGDDETPGSLPPVALPRPARAITAGDYHTCAILDNGAVYCWGHAAFGQLGAGAPSASEVPSPVGPLNLGGRAAVAISAGSAHTCAILDDGAVRCWGFNGNGQLGVGDKATRNEPGPVVSLSGRAVAIGAAPGYLKPNTDAWVVGAHTCAVLESGAVQCWGFNGDARLGSGGYGTPDEDNPNRRSALTPAPPVSLGAGARARAITLGNAHTCVLLADDAVRCWGFNDDGRLGNGQVGNTVGDDETPGAAPPAALGGPAPGSVALLDLGVTPGASAVSVGAETTMQMRVTNTEGDPAGVRVKLAPTGGLAVVAGAPNAGAYDAAQGVWDTGRLQSGQSAVLTVRVQGTAPGAAAVTGNLTGATAMDPRVDAPAAAQVAVNVSPATGTTTTDGGGTTPPDPSAASLTAAAVRAPRAGLVRTVKVTGQLRLPAGMPAAACSGVVRVSTLAGKRLVVRRNVKVRGTATRCTYSASLKVPAKRVGSVKRLRVTTSFLGNALVPARPAPARNVAVRMPPLPRRITVSVRRGAGSATMRSLSVSGTVTLPAGAKASVCTGRVRVSARSGTRTIAGATAKLRRVGSRCTYSRVLRVRTASAGAPRVVVAARFLGTTRMQARDSKGVSVRL